MDWSMIFGSIKYLFMGIFIVFFVKDIKSKKSFKTHYSLSITIAIIFSVIGWQWSMGFKVGFIALVVLLTVKTIIDEKKRWLNNAEKVKG